MEAEGIAVARVAEWLLAYLIHSTLLLGAAEVVGRRVRSAGVRDVLWKVAMVGGLLSATLEQLPAGAAAVRAGAALDAAGAESGAWPLAEVASVLSVDARWASLFLWIWLTCALPLTVLRAAGYVRLRLLLRSRRPAPNGTVRLQAGRIAERGGVRGLRLTLLDGLPTPIALGSREICLPPRALTELDAAEREGMLAHEIAHLRRRDPWWLLAAHLLEAVFWIQPLHRLGRRRLVEVSEEACDRWAAGESGDAVALARCLVDVARWSATGPAAPLVGVASGAGALAMRVDRLLAGPAPEGVGVPARAAAGLALLVAVAWAGPGVRVDEAAERMATAASGRAASAPLDRAWAERNRRLDPAPLFQAQAGAAAAGPTAFCWAMDGLPADPACRVRIRGSGRPEIQLSAAALERLSDDDRFLVRAPGGDSVRRLRVIAVDHLGDQKTVLLVDTRAS